MSYQAVSGARPFVRRAPRPAFGSLLDMSVSSNAYYIPLVEVFDNKLGRRSYSWGQTRYLSNWDAIGYAQSLSKTLPLGYQTCTLYEWSKNAWRKSPVPRM